MEYNFYFFTGVFKEHCLHRGSGVYNNFLSTLQLRFSRICHWISSLSSKLRYPITYFIFILCTTRNTVKILFCTLRPTLILRPSIQNTRTFFFVALLPSILFLPTLYANFAPAGQKYISLFSSHYEHQVYFRLTVRLLFLHARRPDFTSLDFPSHYDYKN